MALSLLSLARRTTVPKAVGWGLVPALRQAIAAIERKGVALEDATDALPFGIAQIDAVLGGGLAKAALHEVAAANEMEVAAATGFVLMLAARRAQAGVVLWVAEDMAACESGRPY